MIDLAMNLALLSAFSSPALTAEPAEKAVTQLGGFSIPVSAAEVKAPAPVPADLKAPPAQPWDAAAKAAYEAALDAGGLTAFADLLELPPGARRQLEQELQSLPQGPGNSSEAFKMPVNGRTAFVVQSYLNGDSLRVHIFNAAGVLVARGKGSVDVPFAGFRCPGNTPPP